MLYPSVSIHTACTGPTFDVLNLWILNKYDIESSITIVNLEGDHESEEKETEKKIFEESVYLDYAKIDSCQIINSCSGTKNYQSVFLKSFSPPPEVC